MFLAIVRRTIAIGSILLVSGCSGNKSLQNPFAPDPKLTQANPNNTTVAENSAKSSSNLPADFPLYPQAKLQSTEQTTEKGLVTTWTTPDPIDFVYKFYQQQLVAKQWEIVTQPSDTEPQLVAKQAQSTVTISAPTSTDKQQTGLTTYSIVRSGPTDAPTPSPVVSSPASPTPSTSPIPTTKPISTAPATTADYLADLTQLGVLTSADTTTANKSLTVTRRAYARWLIAAYNRINSSKPAQQIKLASSDAKPAFQDVPTTHPDFSSIQGLAEAGLIPSPLSGDTTAVLFRPDAPLTREQMILWKVPLDTRQPLPTASLDAVKQTWGFQDTGKIEPKALRAVLADFQNGDQSNIRRVFGYTTLFQPKKTVNLGEVAIAIWYFGANSEGLSARDALQITK